jgi:hypothetical protein
MTSTSIDLSKNTDPLIVDCLKAIKNVAKKMDIGFFVVAAVAIRSAYMVCPQVLKQWISILVS